MEKTYTERGIRATAKELLKSDTDTLPVKDWGDGNTLFVSLKKESIFATGVITVDTKKIFVGSKKK